MTQFSELPLEPEVLQALDNMGFKTMSPIQEMAFPKLMSGSDFLGQAPTGTGKTAAFGIPLINRIKPGTGRIEALIVGPTRELVQQISEELNRIGAVKGVKALPIYGGENVFAQKEVLRERNAQIIVGTPGRLLDHLRQVSIDLSQTRMLILDEADEMLDMGFRPDIEDLFKQLPGGRETWLFSATISPEIRKIADQYMYYPEEVRIQPQTMSASNITQYYYVVDEEDKPRLMRHLLKTLENVYGIIFCQTKKDVVTLARKLRDSFPLDCLHGAMQQSDRDQVMDEFKKSHLKMIVATDIVARGIDVDSLTHIINYEPPGDPESYIHRIGRTARKGEKGAAITLFTPDQEWSLRQLEKRVGMALEKHPDCQLDFDPDATPRRGGRGRGGSRSGGSRSGGGGYAGRSDRRGGGGGHRHAPAAQGGEGEAVVAATGEGGDAAPKKRRRRPRRRGPKPEGVTPMSGGEPPKS